MTYKIISSKQLGLSCWAAYRFIAGHRCQRVFACKSPDKKGCKAVEAEIAYINEHRVAEEQKIRRLSDERLNQLKGELHGNTDQGYLG